MSTMQAPLDHARVEAFATTVLGDMAGTMASILGSEGGPFFIGGGYQALLNELNVIDRVAEAFTSGGGVPQATYPPGTFEGQCRFSRAWYEHLLLPQWIPAVPGLEAGASFADVGCGAGQALITLAHAFPRSTFVGYDSFEEQIERAGARAEQAGLSDRIRFELLDAADGLPERYDVVSTFDVVHDAPDPIGLLRAIRSALEPDGTYLLLEMNCADDAADNVGPLATLLYGISILYCTPTSLAQGGAGLGTCGCPPATLREVCPRWSGCRSTTPLTSSTRPRRNRPK